MRKVFLMGIVTSLGITTACTHPGSPIAAAQAQSFDNMSARVASLEAELASMNERLKEMRAERNQLLNEIESMEQPSAVSPSSNLSAELSGLRSELATVSSLLNARDKAQRTRKRDTRRHGNDWIMR